MTDISVSALAESQEGARVRALDSLKLMGTAPEERFDRITRIARELFDVPDALVNFLDEDFRALAPSGEQDDDITIVALWRFA